MRYNRINLRGQDEEKQTLAANKAPALDPDQKGAYSPTQAASVNENKQQEAPSYDAYVPSDAVRQAQAMLQQQMANKPGDYSSQYAGQIQGILDQIMNRDKFSYDMNADAIYRQYADQYARQGKLAMMDTMGQAAAMTGGYGNSYAQSVGQQAYQGYMQQLNEVMPELYGMALDRYNQEGEALMNQYGLLAAQEEQEYGRHRDQVADYYTELQRLTEDARYVAEDEYSKWLDERNYEYQVGRDAVEDARYEEQWAWEKAQAERASGSSGEGTGASGYELEHVATMSSEAIVAAMSNYNAAGDDTGLAAFLDDLVATGRITEAMADQWYQEYKAQKDEGPQDTEVEDLYPDVKSGGSGSGLRDPIVRVPLQ